MGESENFSLYRTELSTFLDNGPCLPFLGNFLTEIAQTHTYLACRRKKQLKLGKQTSSTRKNDKVDKTDGSMMNGVTPSLNGVRKEPNESGQISPRQGNGIMQDSSDKRKVKVKRSSSRSKLLRLGSSIHDSGVMLNRSRNSSTEVLNVPEYNLQQSCVTSSSDSVITSTGSLNESPRNPASGSSRTPGRPPLLRRLSESSSHQSRISLGKPRRRFSESKSSETRRSLKALIRRTPSSQSVKEGRVSRGSSSEKLTVSLSTLSITENSNALESFVERLAKSQSSPSVKEGSRVSPELQPDPLGSSPEVESKPSTNRNSLMDDSPTASSLNLQSGELCSCCVGDVAPFYF